MSVFRLSHAEQIPFFELALCNDGLSIMSSVFNPDRCRNSIIDA